MFPQKETFDSGDFFHFEGSIYSDDFEDSPVNNFISGWCWQARMECELTSIDEISSSQETSKFVGAPFNETIKIRKWDEREIVADSEGKHPQQCNWYEIKIDRKTEEIGYTRIPTKSPDPATCKHVTPKVYRWRIDNGKAYTTNADGSKRERE